MEEKNVCFTNTKVLIRLRLASPPTVCFLPFLLSLTCVSSLCFLLSGIQFNMLAWIAVAKHNAQDLLAGNKCSTNG